MPETPKPKILTQPTRRLMIALGVTTLILAAMVPLLQHTWLHLSLLWNIFLAALPLLFAWLLARRWAAGKQGLMHRLLNGILWVLWLAFFPNAPYMFTDIIHVSRFSYDVPGGVYTASLPDWLGIAHIFVAILVGCLCGCLALYLLHLPLAKRHGTRWGWLFCAGVSLLSGVGVYIGRVMRFNSWDILNRPLALLEQFFSQINPTFIMLMLLFSAITLGLYLFFYLCFRHSDK